MSNESQIEQAAKQAVKALRKVAADEHEGNTEVVLVVYAIESFLRRLAVSDYASRMVLKGGMLLAAAGVRDVTRDADLSTHGISNDAAHIQTAVAEVLRITPSPHDGVVFDLESIEAEVMREDAEYHGIRVTVRTRLGNAKPTFKLDFSFGDPGTSEFAELPSLIERDAIRLRAYPMELSLAEKVVTAMQRKETSTRDRDFADVWAVSRLYSVDASKLRAEIHAVATHRVQAVIPMAVALALMPNRQISYRRMVESRSYHAAMPELWTELLAGVIAFIDPLLDEGGDSLTSWNPSANRWS